MTGFTLHIPGEPKGKQRARHGQGKTFTPRETLLAEQEIRRAWEQAGKPRLHDGPVVLEVVLSVTRPASHFKRDGTLTLEGRRCWSPARKKPDVDNALKLVMDALNTRAWRDDVQVVDASVARRWDRWAGTEIAARELEAP